MNTSYDTDIVAWANEQAALLRAGKLSSLDIEHIAEEIEDVGKSEKRELASRLSVLLAHLLKWQYQPEYRGSSWAATINEQRRQVTYQLEDVPSLKSILQNPRTLDLVWGRAKTFASKETGLGFDGFPEVCPWSVDNVLTNGWLPVSP